MEFSIPKSYFLDRERRNRSQKIRLLSADVDYTIYEGDHTLGEEFECTHFQQMQQSWCSTHILHCTSMCLEMNILASS